MAGKPRGTRYDYPMIDIHFRVSIDAYDMVRDMAHDTYVCNRDIILTALLQYIDPAHTCPDWKTIPAPLE